MSWLRLRRKPDFSVEARLREIDCKFGASRRDAVLTLLANVNHPTDQILSAIVFVAGEGSLAPVESAVASANADATQFLNNVQVVADRR